MAQYFLASVGNCSAFAKQSGQIVPYFDAKTLTNSSISINVSAEDIRGGQGAQLLGKFFHTSVFDLSMEDAIFKLEYIAMQVGAEIETGANVFVSMNNVQGTTDSITLTQGAPQPVLTGTSPIVMYRKTTEIQWSYVVPTGSSITIPNADTTAQYCIKYIATNDAARKIVVGANFIPKEIIVYLTTQLFAGDASAPETGKPVGSITVKIPRFQLNGTQELSMSMASAATISIAGSALANTEGCTDAYYGEIIEVIDGANWYDNATALLVDNAEQAVAVSSSGTLDVYAIFSNSIPGLVEGSSSTNKKLKFTSSDTTNLLFADGNNGAFTTEAAFSGAVVTVEAVDSTGTVITTVEPGIANITLQA